MYYSRALCFLAQLFQLLTSVSTLRNGAIEIPTPAKYEDDEKPSNYYATAKYLMTLCFECRVYLWKLYLQFAYFLGSIVVQLHYFCKILFLQRGKKWMKSKATEKMYFLAVPTVQVEALVGHTTKLPCQMNSTRSSDVFLVLWYVDLDGKPIYR